MNNPLDISQTRHTGRVLVADDDRGSREFLRIALDESGHSVLTAEDGIVALEQALHASPDVILLDITMPKMNGIEVCRQLRQDPRTAHVPILIITGLASQSDRLAAIEAGANDFLNKPVSLDELRLRVSNSVYQHSLFTELSARYKELKEMAELRASLTSLIEADTQTLSVLMHQPEPPKIGENHGAN